MPKATQPSRRLRDSECCRELVSTAALPERLLMWKNDPDLCTLTITDARKEVNKRVVLALVDLVGGRPTPQQPHHNGHPVLDPKMSVGHQNINVIGAYFSLVSSSSTSEKILIVKSFSVQKETRSAAETYAISLMLFLKRPSWIMTF